jgi:hypothetical protein
LRVTTDHQLRYVHTSYAVLTDAVKRKQFDAGLQSARYRYHARPYSAGAF